MPVLQPQGQQAKADKVMTLDLAALHNANAPAAPATSSQAPAATTAAANPAQDPDFAEPPNPFAPVQSSEPAAQTSQATAPRPQYPWMPPQAQPSQQAGPPQNPWAALQSQQAGPPSIPVEMSQSVAAQPAATSAPAPVAASSAPAQPKCFTNSEGVKICYMDDEQKHNTTDVHKEGGVNDYHNQASSHNKEAIQGHIPGKNVTNTLNNLGQNPPPDEHKDGNTVFQGQNEANFNQQHDIHKDNGTYTDHEVTNGDMDTDWNSANKGPDGRKDMAEVNKDKQFSNEEDTRINSQGKDKVDVEETKGSNDHKFMSDRPGTEDDSSLVWDEDDWNKKQKEEFQGNGVYDLHEEDNSGKKFHAKVDGDQGWKEFEADMNDFDTFDNDEAWKAKMQDPRSQATASASIAMPSLSTLPTIARRHHKEKEKKPSKKEQAESRRNYLQWKSINDQVKEANKVPADWPCEGDSWECNYGITVQGVALTKQDMWNIANLTPEEKECFPLDYETDVRHGKLEHPIVDPEGRDIVDMSLLNSAQMFKFLDGYKAEVRQGGVEHPLVDPVGHPLVKRAVASAESENWEPAVYPMPGEAYEYDWSRKREVADDYPKVKPMPGEAYEYDMNGKRDVTWDPAVKPMPGEAYEYDMDGHRPKTSDEIEQRQSVTDGGDAAGNEHIILPRAHANHDQPIDASEFGYIYDDPNVLRDAAPENLEARNLIKDAWNIWKDQHGTYWEDHMREEQEKKQQHGGKLMARFDRDEANEAMPDFHVRPLPPFPGIPDINGRDAADAAPAVGLTAAGAGIAAASSDGGRGGNEKIDKVGSIIIVTLLAVFALMFGILAVKKTSQALRRRRDRRSRQAYMTEIEGFHPAP